MPQEPFIVAPALDVLEGRCVRLREGVRERVTVEGGDPVEAAKRFAADGARILHLVDLDGAFSGRPSAGLVERVAGAVELPVLAAGGIASLDDLRAVKAIGCEGAIAGSALWLGRFTLAEALAAVA